MVKKISKKIRKKKVTLKKSYKKKVGRVAKKVKIIARKKQVGAFELRRPEENPIISPRIENHWEAWQTFNPGVILLDGKIHFIYRAIGEDGISRLGYAASNDGFTIDERLSYPIYGHRLIRRSFNYYSFSSGGSFGGVEDPRLVRVDDEDTIYMTYTACDEGLRVGLTSIKVTDFLKKKWNWKPPVLISSPAEVHKNWVIFPEKINGKYAILHSISPEIAIDFRDNLEFEENEYIQSCYANDSQRKNYWDNWVRGAGAPPIRTRLGWLLLYHAIDNTDPGKYKVGAMILDSDDPTKILYRSQAPILEPEKDYENNGFKSGVVYVTGAVVKDGELLVYYGASDSYVCVAHGSLEDFLAALAVKVVPKLRARNLKKKD